MPDHPAPQPGANVSTWLTELPEPAFAAARRAFPVAAPHALQAALKAAAPHIAAAGDCAMSAKLARIRELHQPFGIYDECGCDPEDHAGKTITYCGDFETCLDAMYWICAHCCRDADGEQTEECVSEHAHGPVESICETAAILDAPAVVPGRDAAGGDR